MNKMPLLLLSLVGFACAPKAETGSSAAAKPATTAAPAAAAAPVRKTVDVELLRTKLSPEELVSACEKAEKDTDARLAKVVAIEDGKRTFENTMLELENATADYAETVARLSFLKHVHTDAKVREAGGVCEERAGKYAVRLGARKDLYQAVKAWQTASKESLDPQQKRLVEITMRDFRRNGLELPDEKREELVKIRQRITELESKFQTNLGEDKTSIEVTKEELAGMPEDFIASLKKSKSGKLVVTTKYPHYYPVMENCRVEATRKKLETAMMNRGGGKTNIALLDEAVELRRQAAKILGYETHTDYVLEPRMAKDAKTAQEFLTRMREGLKPGLEELTAKMQALKAADTKNPNAKIQSWDWRYYQNQIKQRDYAIDDEAVRAYFPTDKVMAGMFDVYSRLFGIELKEVPNAEVWAEDVKLYEVIDSASKVRIARFYVDPFPREGKYGHAAQFTLSSGRETANGYKIPFASLVMNFQPPAEGRRSHLSIDEVETLFHEFGHVMHESLTTARYASLSGTNVARDFVEAPSQMLENWVYQPEVLALISADPKDPSKPLPQELAQKLIAARTYNAGIHYSRQVFLGVFDQALHASTSKVDSDALAKKLWLDVMGYGEDPKSHFAGTFGHMMGGYEGGYYGYLWSEVFSADMFTRFQKEGVLNEKVGRAYRDTILAKGRVEEPEELLRQFLGREPSQEAFLRLVGIKKSS